MPTIRDLRHARRSRNDQNAPAIPRRSHVVDCAVYVDGHRQPGRCTYDEAIAAVRASGRGFVWIGLHEPAEGELSGLAARFGLHPLAVEDAVHAHQRPKLERYDDVLFVVFKTVCYVPPTGSVDSGSTSTTREIVETGEIMAFLGNDFVITVRHGDHGELRTLRRILEDDPERMAFGPSAVLHAVADRVVDDYMAVSRSVQDDVDAVERAVFSTRRSRDAERIYQLKREVLELRRATAPLAQPLDILAERPMRPVPPRVREYFRDVNDHLTRVNEGVASLDELLTTLVQANLAQVAVAQNEDMRKISAWVAIVSVPTAVAGVYGMNFSDMPELHWRFGYPVVMGLVLVICLALHRGFRRNGWL
ncbi:MAG TPA: magnesium and cobalt transport protein CorA [Mycobacteriales bacterium]